MPEILALSTIALFSLLLVRSSAVALTLTGLTPEVARFQALSAFMGVGFTTTESETVVGHPVRRRVIAVTMTLGYLMISSGLVTVVFTFANTSKEDVSERAVFVVLVVVLLLVLPRVPFVDRFFTRNLTRVLSRAPALTARDYEELLQIDKGYSISHVQIEEDCWLASKPLRELKLNREGVLILSVHRVSGAALAAPGPDTVLEHGDRIVVYGREIALTKLGARPGGQRGELEHEAACARLRSDRAEETALDLETEAETEAPVESDSP